MPHYDEEKYIIYSNRDGCIDDGLTTTRSNMFSSRRRGENLCDGAEELLEQLLLAVGPVGIVLQDVAPDGNQRGGS